MSLSPTTSGRIATFDGLRLVHRTWEAQAPRAGVFVVHGFYEHGLRYQHLVERLVPSGFSVMTWDLRGHGDSGGRRGHIDSFSDYHTDATMMLEIARTKLPSPLFVLGHSVGGLIVTQLCLQGRIDADGVVLSNPALSLRMPVPGWKIALGTRLSRWVPIAPVPSDLPPELISRDPDEVAKYVHDPKVFTAGTARFGKELLDCHSRLVGQGSSFTFSPTLVQLGAADGIIDPLTSKNFFSASKSESCQIEVYPDAYHELYNEPKEVRDVVLGDLETWLLSAVSRI